MKFLRKLRFKFEIFTNLKLSWKPCTLLSYTICQITNTLNIIIHFKTSSLNLLSRDGLFNKTQIRMFLCISQSKIPHRNNYLCHSFINQLYHNQNTIQHNKTTTVLSFTSNTASPFLPNTLMMNTLSLTFKKRKMKNSYKTRERY